MTRLNKPHFLCIGAQKAGTTWLYHNLRRHPEIWLPPLKEIHYFDRRPCPLMLDALRGRYQRDMLWRWLLPAFEDMRQNPQSIGWYIPFFLSWRSERWYENRFQNAPHQQAGDITPAYARLSLSQVRGVYERLPDARIIYLLRNPIERLWSQAAMYFSHFGYPGLERVSEMEVFDFLNWELARRNSDYLQTLGIWEQFYLREQIHLVFFEQITETPAQVMQDTYGFLGIDADRRYVPQDVGQKVHHRSYSSMPERVAIELARQYYPQIVKLHEVFDNAYTYRWLESVKAIFQQAHVPVPQNGL